MKKLSLEEILEGIEDTRKKQRNISFIMLTAILCGATSYARIELFAQNKKEWLKKYLVLENGIPDANTFRYIMLKITPQKNTRTVCRMNEICNSVAERRCGY